MQKLQTIATKKLAENLKKLRKPMKITQLNQKLIVIKFIRNGKTARSQQQKKKH